MDPRTHHKSKRFNAKQTHQSKVDIFNNLQEAADPEADLDYVVCSLDALSGVAEALGFRFEGVLSRAGPQPTALRDILLQCCQDASPDIRQSAFALVGDLAKVCAAYSALTNRN